MEQRVESVQVADGAFDLTVWLPAGGGGPGVLLIQEIFGVGDYLYAVARDLAALGYVVAAPDLFWRIKPGHATGHDEAGLAESLAVSAQFDPGQGVSDTVAALAHLRALPEVSGGVGLLGFCLGGSIAYLAAAVADPEAVVSFYGSAVPDHVDMLGQISCPVQFHFGGADPYIPRDRVRLVEEAASGHGNVEFHVEEEAGHAFHNRVAPMFYQPGPAARAWERTEEFLRRNLPVRAVTG